MLKYAFQYGFNAAIKEAGLTPAQMQATQLAGGVGGGALGATGGALLGKHLGGTIADQFKMEDKDRAMAKLISSGAFGLLGGAGGAVLGSQLPRALLQTTPAPHPGENMQPEYGSMYATPYDSGYGDESALGALPSAYTQYNDTDYYGY